MTVRLLFRRGVAADWTSANPVLSTGEPGFETDTGKFKIGDGTSTWNTLPYLDTGTTTITVGTVSTGAPGTSASVTNVGTVQDAIFNFTIPRGDTGLTGPNGLDGLSLRSGSGAPSSGLGNDGDFYIDGVTYDLYGPKTGGAWGSPFSLAGADGRTILNGTGAPSVGTGLDGDFYIDTGSYLIYGPKTGGAWGSGTSLVGPSGAGSGDVLGPASSTDNAITRFDGTTGKLLQNSTVTISDLGVITLPAGGDIRDNGGTTVLKTNLDSLTDVTITTPTNGQVLKYNGTAWVNGTDNTGSSGTVTTVSVASANGFAGTVANATTTPAITLTTSVTGVLKGNGTAISAAVAGTDYQAPITLTTTGSSGAATLIGNTLNIPQYTGGGGGGLVSRSTAAGTTASLANGSTGNVSITGFKAYALFKVQTSAAAWVRIYTDTASRTADASRLEGTDPTAGSGVIAEVITTGAQTILISPGTIGFNNEGTPTTAIPIAVTNKSGSTGTITVTLTLLQIEA